MIGYLKSLTWFLIRTLSINTLLSFSIEVTWERVKLFVKEITLVVFQNLWWYGFFYSSLWCIFLIKWQKKIIYMLEVRHKIGEKLNNWFESDHRIMIWLRWKNDLNQDVKIWIWLVWFRSCDSRNYMIWITNQRWFQKKNYLIIILINHDYDSHQSVFDSNHTYS